MVGVGVGVDVSVGIEVGVSVGVGVDVEVGVGVGVGIGVGDGWHPTKNRKPTTRSISFCITFFCAMITSCRMNESAYGNCTCEKAFPRKDDESHKRVAQS
jgi:hypothetical protein